jgi:hypothetical protein
MARFEPPKWGYTKCEFAFLKELAVSIVKKLCFDDNMLVFL